MYKLFRSWMLLLPLWTGLLPPVEAVEVPEPLAPWAEWVGRDLPERDCPLMSGHDARNCVWLSGLELRLDGRGGDFVMRGHVYAEGWLALPGSAAHWPMDIRSHNVRVPVLRHADGPALWVAAGPIEVRGRFRWQALPTGLRVPPELGLVSLWVAGQPVPVTRDTTGLVWLGAPQSLADDAIRDELALRVHRRIDDHAAMRVDTQIVLDVAGRQREVLLAAPVLDGFTPIILESPLPARLEPDQRLRVQLRPGRWVIEVAAYRVGEVDRLLVPAAEAPWPDEEFWVFAAQPHLRQVEPQGLTAIDPRQSTLPPTWHRFPAFAARPGEELRLPMIRRGDPEPAPDTLHLDRQLWLDFDGGGYTVQDRLSGRVSQSWRLDAAPQLALGRVSVDATDQLITRRDGQDTLGVELRRGELDLVAESRYTGAAGQIPIGWQHDFNSARMRLHLPPGWGVFAVSGVDNDPPSWVQRWTLLDLFLVLITALAVARLWGLRAGLLALLALAAVWHAPGAPQQVWLHLIAALALLRVVPAGRLRSLLAGYRNLALLVLLMISIPFIITQARTALHPQLALPVHGMPMGQLGSEVEMPASAAVMRKGIGMEALSPGSRSAVASAPLPESLARSRTKTLDFRQIDPAAKVQTGPGLPKWQWQAVDLAWRGPVDAGQRVDLVLLSPVVNRGLNMAQILLLLAFAGLLLRDRTPGGPPAWVRALLRRHGD